MSAAEPVAASAAEPRPDGRIVALLATLIAIQPLSTDLYLPSLPLVASDLGETAAAVQSTLTVYILAFALVQLLAGPLSDRFGRRPVVLAGLAAHVAGSLLAAAAGSLSVLLAARLLQAVGTCCTVVCARAIVRDRFDPATGAQRLSQALTWVALMPLLAPIAGGLVAGAWGWRAAFVVMAAFGLAALLACARGLPESNVWRDPRAMRPSAMLSGYVEVMRSATWWRYTLVGAAMYWGLFAFLAESPFVLRETHRLSPAASGLAIALIAAGFMVGALTARRTLPRYGTRRTVAGAGLAAATAGLALLALALARVNHVAAVLAPLCLFVFAHGLSQAGWQAASVAPFPRRAGAAAAMTGFVQNLLAACVGVLVGVLHDGSALPMAAMVAAAGVAASGIAVRGARATDAPRASS